MAYPINVNILIDIITALRVFSSNDFDVNINIVHLTNNLLILGRVLKLDFRE